MREQILDVANVFPDKEKLIALSRAQDKLFGKVAGDHTFLVIVDALTVWSPYDPPTSFPGIVAHIGVFPVERFIE